MQKLAYCLVLFLFASPFTLPAQWGPGYEAIKIMVSADHEDWVYEKGEEVNFSISAFHYGSPMNGATVHYEIGPEKMKPQIKDKGILKNGKLLVKSKGLTTAGFLRCTATIEWEGKTYKGMATAGFIPDDIQPTTELPEDFVSFWEKAKEAAAKIPMDVKMEKIAELSDESLDVYHVRLQSYRYGSRLYGVLNVPKKAVKMPAILKVPGAGVWPAFLAKDADAKQGFITFEIRIHGIPVVGQGNDLYTDLYLGGLNEYWNYNLDDKDHYYYKRVYMGCVRAVDFIYSLPEFDGQNLAVSGGSQGGALSIVTAALDDRIKYLVSYYPALCDLTGYLHGRAGGWPHLFDDQHKQLNHKPDKIETSKYYDVVNFARQVKVPGYYVWGYNDEVCPPTSMHAAYNVITAPKQLLIAKNAGHHHFPEQQKVTNEWLWGKLREQ